MSMRADLEDYRPDERINETLPEDLPYSVEDDNCYCPRCGDCLCSPGYGGWLCECDNTNYYDDEVA